ncbi:unnamed protein product [Gongylonema pulchrum]|uniref:Mediator of RNA polymerase II transcription subunit 24 n=1 Tax=Gongylonema pulchrum TaxID=637853 RepID=A0A183DTI4_9BILA|nr:unnamed protein product [Gongylonema pulchrum]
MLAPGALRERKILLQGNTHISSFQLNRFSSVLKNASELYSTADQLLKYCLPRCTFKQLVEDILNDSGGSGNSETFRLVADILQRIAANTASAISAFANEKKLKIDLNAEQSWELYEKCSGEKLENTLANCLILFHAVYDVRCVLLSTFLLTLSHFCNCSSPKGIELYLHHS